MDGGFCARCGEALGRRLDRGRERPNCGRCGHVVYRNPAPVAMALTRQGDRVLLVQRAAPPLQGFWTPPAGYVELDESAVEAAVREAREETGLEVAITALHGVYSQAGAGILLVVYDAQVVGGRLAAGDDARAARLCALNALPPQPRHHGGTLLEGWFLSVIEALLAQPSRVITTDAPAPQEQAAGTGADASERARSLRSHVRGLEQRLADLAAEMDAAREDMAEAAIDDGKIREVGQLKREIEHWRGELAALQEAS